MPKKTNEEPPKFTLAQLQEDSAEPDDKSEDSFEAPSSSSSNQSESSKTTDRSGSGSRSRSSSRSSYSSRSRSSSRSSSRTGSDSRSRSASHSVSDSRRSRSRSRSGSASRSVSDSRPSRSSSRSRSGSRSSSSKSYSSYTSRSRRSEASGRHGHSSRSSSSSSESKASVKETKKSTKKEVKHEEATESGASSSSSSSSVKDDSDSNSESEKKNTLAKLSEQELKKSKKGKHVDFEEKPAEDDIKSRPKKKGKNEGSIPLSKIATIRDKGDEKPKGAEDPDFYLRQSYSKLGLAHMEERVMLRVYLADNSFKTLYINPKTSTTTDVWRMLCEKLQLPPSEWGYFFLWTISSDAEILMYADSLIEDAAKEYPELRASFSHPVGYRAPGDSRLHSFVSQLTGTKRGKSGLSASKYVIEHDAVTFQDVPAGPKSPRLDKSLTQTGMSLSMSMYSVKDVAAYSATVSGQKGDATSRNGLASTLHRTKSQNTLLQTISGTGSTSTEGFAAKFMFRLTQVLPHIEEMKITSPAGVRLLFIQGVHDVLVGNHPVSPGVAVKLAALQLYASKGPFKSAAWKEGTVSGSLASYVPKHLHSQYYAKSWESSICEVYQSLGQDMKEIDCQTAYLDILKRLPSYGSTYFPVTYTPSDVTPFKQFFQGDVTLAINAIGIHLIDVRLCRRKDVSAIVTFPFQRILSWDAEKLTFFFEYQKLNSTNGKSSLFSFSTPNAKLINDLMHDWLEAFQEYATEVRESQAAAVKDDSKSKSKSKSSATTTTTTTTSKSKSKSHSSKKK